MDYDKYFFNGGLTPIEWEYQKTNSECNFKNSLKENSDDDNLISNFTGLISAWVKQFENTNGNTIDERIENFNQGRNNIINGNKIKEHLKMHSKKQLDNFKWICNEYIKEMSYSLIDFECSSFYYVHRYFYGMY